MWRQERDERRDEGLRGEGYQVLRFWDHEFYENREGVLQKIADACFGSPSPLPPPLKGGGVNLPGLTSGAYTFASFGGPPSVENNHEIFIINSRQAKERVVAIPIPLYEKIKKARKKP